jgi:transposase
LKKDLKRFPYKVQLKQLLTPSNKQQRLEFANELSSRMEKKRNGLKVRSIHFSDEANFYLSGFVNSQNTRIWGLEQPHATVTKQNSKKKVMVWCAITSDGIIGPYFFTGNVNAEIYLEMLRTYYIPELKKKKVDCSKNFFQQDGATVHCTADVLQYLEQNFGKNIISRRCEFAWPPYSPDLNPLDFFLWGHLKTLVYRDPAPTTVDELKKKIRDEIRKLNRNKEMFASVYDNFLVRIQQLYSKKGGYMEHVLNY